MSEIYLDSLIAPKYYDLFYDMTENRHDEYWLGGGRGSGKSTYVSVLIPFGMLNDPNANAIVFRKISSTLRESVYSQIEWTLAQMELTDMFTFRKVPMEIIYRPTGQKIHFRGLDDPNKMKSIKLAHGYYKYLWIEEVTELRDMSEIMSIKASVLRGSGGHNTQTILTYNPPISQRNWVNRESLIEKEGRVRHTSTYLDVPAEWLGERFIADAEQIREQNERVYRHMYLGEVTGTGGAVFENLEIRDITDEEIETYDRFYQGMDFGWYPDPTHWVRMAYNAGNRTLIIFDEYRECKAEAERIAKILTEKKHVEPWDEIICDLDRRVISKLATLGLNAIGTSKPPGSVDSSTKWLQGLNKIIIDNRRCPETAREFLEYEYERDRRGEVVAGYPDKDNHGIDAVRYGLNRVWLTRGA